MAPPTVTDLLDSVLHTAEPERQRQILANARPVDHKGKYLHWDQIRHRRPPDGLTHEEWWLGTRLIRDGLRRDLPLTAVDGTSFSICMVDAVGSSLHRIDKAAAGDTLADEPSIARGSRGRYVVSSLIEEAIASSQLEGASTTRAAAKQMLLEGRRPRDRSERMIFNNYMAIRQLADLAAGEDLFTPDAVCELHRVLVEGTLDDASDAGRVQAPGEERVFVTYSRRVRGPVRVHTPPPAAELPRRMEAMCAFANVQVDDEFVHPVLRAIVLHFWLAYDHPFVDGNGRLARSLFYWSMLRSGYWLTEYLAISAILRRAPAKYAMSYLHTETDGNDLTYFVLYQLDVIERAIEALRQYMKAKRAEVCEVEELLRGKAQFNHRQRDVLARSLRDPDAEFAIADHQNRHVVTYQTARTDLLGLAEADLLTKERNGKAFRFLPAGDLSDRIRRL